MHWTHKNFSFEVSILRFYSIKIKAQIVLRLFWKNWEGSFFASSHKGLRGIQANIYLFKIINTNTKKGVKYVPI